MVIAKSVLASSPRSTFSSYVVCGSHMLRVETPH